MKRSQSNLRYYSGVFLEELGKTIESPGQQVSRSKFELEV
jgi:hypothetical protein